MFAPVRRRFGYAVFAATLVSVTSFLGAAPGQAQSEKPTRVTPFMQAVAVAAAKDPDISAFYKANMYQPIWTGQDADDAARRVALLTALDNAGDHALPVASYKTDWLRDAMRTIRTERELGALEAEMSRIFLKYARDVHTGVLAPRTVDAGIVRDVPLQDRQQLLQDLSTTASPVALMRSLPPRNAEYNRLLKAKVKLERLMAKGGWGPEVPASSLKPGQSGQAVVALRNRLIAMGYMRRSVSQVYDAELERAVSLFQFDNGLEQDGVAGAGTIKEVNKQIEDRLPNLLVAMERERWMNIDRGERHVWVNLTDFTAAIIDHGEVTFKTRSVIGANQSDRRSPEFSDVMEYMEINPYWNVPRSIAVNEYLPRMIAAGGAAAGHLQLVDGRGRVISRGSVNWGAYSTRNFPFDLRQPPSRSNALGLVKFMFPNPQNVYLHDTPAKSLFSREVRAFSHGCIRLNDPFDFAYELLRPQTDDPVGLFHRHLDSGQNIQVYLDTPIPVHLVYRTAFTTAKGRLGFRRDVYGRDARIFDALMNAGVALNALRS